MDRNRSFSLALEAAISRLASRMASAAKTAAMAGLVFPAAQGFGGCGPSRTTPLPAEETHRSALSDWVHNEGKPDTSMVTYMTSFWTQFTDCGYRGGCQGIDVFLKLKVKRLEGVDLSKKKVGIYCNAPFCEDRTAVGYYFGDMGDGYEEWHVPFNRRAWERGAFTFTAWYQDGKGNTWYDDNAGELHAVAYQGNHVIIRQDRGATDVRITEAGVTGRVVAILANLDYDKFIRMVWTTDDWKTVNQFDPGEADKPNAWHWLDSLGPQFERWELKLDIPGPVERFEYALLYRHGVINGAKTYDFWDNDGGMNYLVTKDTTVIPSPDLK